MNPDRKIESPDDACRTILRFMREYEKPGSADADTREALLEDLCAKCRDVPTGLRATFLAEGLYRNAPARIRELFKGEEFDWSVLANLPSERKSHKNIGFVTVIRPELSALLFALGRDPNDKEFETFQPFRYWTGELTRPDDRALSYVVTLVGKPRNVPCALAVASLLNHYSVDLLVLVGIAGGAAGKVELGDAVSADRIYDYEHVRSELTRGGDRLEKPRPAVVDVEEEILNDLSFYEGNGFADLFAANVLRMPDLWLPPGVDRNKLRPDYKRGTLAAGERLFADGSLAEMWKYDERIRGGDMEDSGFAQACKFRRIPWAIFRGIADFGDPQKADGWHHAASLSAACAAHAFLTRAYRVPLSSF